MSGFGVLVFLFGFILIDVFLMYFLAIKCTVLGFINRVFISLVVHIQAGRKIFCQLKHNHALIVA